jgi:hypothetical protein
MRLTVLALTIYDGIVAAATSAAQSWSAAPRRRFLMYLLMPKRPRAAVLQNVVLATACLVACCAVGADIVTVRPSPGGMLITVGGQPFAEYLTCSGSKPIVWPIIGPDGQAMTRAFPMDASHAVTTDHPHHRSLWFTHGEVNGIDFWLEGTGHGKIVHRRFDKVASGREAVLASQNDWIGPTGKKVLSDHRCLTFAADRDTRRIDFTITLTADRGPVVFGDTKEGAFGVRLADWLRVEARQGAHITNSAKQTDDHAWGQRAAWVDYSGRHDGHPVGAAIFNHPASFRYPTPWHVRTYGLFAANPFGDGSFRHGGVKKPFRLEAGKSLTIGYRVLFYRGERDRRQLTADFASYAKTPLGQ